jgi:hypothetical protein
MRQSISSIVLATILVCLLAFPLFAGITGDIQGTVVDPSGAAIAGAKVTITSVDTGQSRVVTTGSSGEFSAYLLDIGFYNVTIEMAGFKSYTQTAEVRNGEKTRVDASMVIGTVGQSVTVESTQLPTLDVSTAQLSSSLSSEEVQSLPNLSRDPVAFATLNPGTVPVTKDNPFLGLGSFNSNGSRGRADNITLDGVTAADVSTTGESGAAFTDQDVLEFKVITNNFDAEFGRNSGAQVQIITKSGTNQYHGEAYYFAQNTFFGNAVDYFTQAAAPGLRPEPTPIIQNQGGANFGGPIIKDHTFIYGSWEMDRTRGLGATVVANVLTPTQAAAITDPTALAIFQADGSPTSASGTLPGNSANSLNAHTWTIRVDQLLRGGKDSLFVKYGQSPSVAISPGLTFISTNLVGFGASNTAAPKDLTVSYTSTFTSNLVNNFRFGFGRSNPIFPANSPFPPGPQIIIEGFDSFGESDIIPQGRTQNTFQYADTVSYTRGRHTIKFGVDINRYQAPSFFPALADGLYVFGTLAQFQSGTPIQFNQFIGPTERHNFALDAFGFVQDDFRVTRSLTLNLGFRLESSGGVSELNNLLSNLDPNNTTPIGQLGTGPLGGVQIGGTAFNRNWNPAPRLGFAWNPGNGKLVVRGGYGIAYDFIYQNPITNLRFSPPFVNQLLLQGASFSGGNTFAALVAGTAPAQLQAEAGLGSFDPNQIDFGGFSPVIQTLSNPRNQQYDFGIEYQAPHDLVLKATYVGTRNDHLQVSQPINHVLPANIPAPPTSLADQTARQDEFLTTFSNENLGPTFAPPLNNRLDPRFDSVVQVQSTGTSNYNSLQIQGIRRFKNGLTFNANYTWSHCIDDVSDALGVLINDSANLLDPTKPLSFQRSNCQFDIRNRVALNYVYDLPFGKGDTGWKRAAFGGWQTSGVFTAQSGLPATLPAPPVNFAPDLAFPNGGSISDLLLDGDSNVSLDGNATLLRPVPDKPGINQPVDPTTIVSEPLLESEGTSGRNHLRLAGLMDFDIAVTKRISFTERFSLQMGWQALNILNHPNFGGYVNNFAASNFNTYTNTSTFNRQFQLFAKFNF